MAKARLGSVVSSVRGSLGGLVVVDGRDGVVVRQKPTYRRPTSAAQREVEGRMRAASALWSSMNAGQAAAWRTWGAARGRTAQTGFVGLATKFLQIDPLATVPLVPPAKGFVPDDVAVSALGETAGVRFVATGPNRAGSATELLVQPLLNERRSPSKDYRTAGFVAFTAAAPTSLLTLAPGSYAVGYRFVEKATGQMGPTLLLGVVRVG